MSTNNSSTTDAEATNESNSNDPIANTDVTIGMLKRPGQLFEVGDCTFLTTGGVGWDGLNVTRVSTGESEQLDVQLLEDDIEDGELSLLDTHSHHQEVAVDRMTLATVTDYMRYDVEEFDERVAADEVDALQDVEAQLD